MANPTYEAPIAETYCSTPFPKTNQARLQMACKVLQGSQVLDTLDLIHSLSAIYLHP
jgi:hypothetical protein